MRRYCWEWPVHLSGTPWRSWEFYGAKGVEMKEFVQAWATAGRQRLGKMRTFGRWLWREWGLVAVFVVFVVVPVKSSLADWNWVPTGSMNPTILEGDLIYVNKVAYDLRVPLTLHRLASWSEPQRGDIIVFLSPERRYPAGQAGRRQTGRYGGNEAKCALLEWPAAGLSPDGPGLPRVPAGRCRRHRCPDAGGPGPHRPSGHQRPGSGGDAEFWAYEWFPRGTISSWATTVM